jgi:hypothetical protein
MVRKKAFRAERVMKIWNHHAVSWMSFRMEMWVSCVFVCLWEKCVILNFAECGLLDVVRDGDVGMYLWEIFVPFS